MCKVQEPRARQIAKWSFSQANGVSQFILFFSAGATSQNFPNPTAIDQFRSVKERRRPDSSERKIYVRHCIVPAACRMFEAWMVTALRRPRDQKKKLLMSFPFDRNCFEKIIEVLTNREIW